MISSCRAVRSVSMSAAHATKPARKVVSKDTPAKPSPLMDPKSLVLYKNGRWCRLSPSSFQYTRDVMSREAFSSFRDVCLIFSDELIALNKPPGLPVHSKKCTVMFIS